MNRKRIFVIIGTRPEAIKMAPVVKEIQKHSDELKLIICSTGQHREMLEPMFSLFEIEPDIDLDLMLHNQTLTALISSAIVTLTRTLEEFLPHLVLVQGDTTTAMVGGLSAFYLKIPVGHIEAGLRTGNRYNPFPEETNRRLISVLATYHFAPTETAMNALLREGISPQHILLTGNTVVDALFMVLQREDEFDLGFSAHLDKLIVVTAHRRENFGKPLENICLALKEIVRRNPDVEIVYPVHLNPNVREPVYRILANEARINLISPLAYEKFVYLMNKSYLILTDSGGVQEEAPTLGKPVLVLRNQTERPEAVEAGIVKIVGTDTQNIVNEVERLLNNQCEYDRMSQAISPYGDGHASERIIRVILESDFPDL